MIKKIIKLFTPFTSIFTAQKKYFTAELQMHITRILEVKSALTFVIIRDK